MSRSLARITTGLVLGLGLNLGLGAADLPPEHEVHRLVIATNAAVSEARWEDASRHLSRLQSLEAKKPPEYQFLRGRIMLQAEKLNAARAALEAYVTEAGAEGDHYGQALQLITQVEDRQQAASAKGAREKPGIEVIADIEPAERIDTEALKSLYLEDSVRGALMAHLNSLLGLNAWQPGPVIQADPEESVKYQVGVGTDRTLQVQSLALDKGAGATWRTQNLSVFGLNPAISHACFDAEDSCWLYDPRDRSRWLRLANRPEPAAETARVLSELIRNLQKGNS